MDLDFLNMFLTTERHSQLTGEIFFELYKQKQSTTYLGLGNRAICYIENLYARGYTLVDISEREPDMLDELGYIVPSIVMFSTNKYMHSADTMKMGGYPNLIVEVWSKWEVKHYRQFKHHVYSTGKNTEHWYLTQNSNKIECWFEDKQLPNKSLKKVLTTQGGLQLDLRELAL